MREMTPQVEIKTNYSFGVLVLGFSQVAAVYVCVCVCGGEGGWMEGATDDVDGRGGIELLEGACENQWPPGRPAELNYQENTVAKGSRKDTASICHTLTAGGGGAVGGRLETE